jgi:hypothetical protein
VTLDEHLQLEDEFWYRHLMCAFELMMICMPFRPGEALIGNAILHRSTRLVDGFSKLFEDRNAIAAAPLVRMQLDNTLRFIAATVVPDAEAFAISLMKGASPRDMRDRNGKRLTDAHLLHILASKHPWARDMYARTSGTIHFSDVHFWSAVQLRQVAVTPLSFRVGGEADLEGRALDESLADFRAATTLLLDTIDEWVHKVLAEGTT